MGCDRRAYRRERTLGLEELGPGGQGAGALGPRTFRITTSWSGPEPEPGQFFMLRPARSSVLLGRPISVEDAGPGRLGFAITERGTGTRELHGLRPGEEVLLEGPLGSAWASAPPVAALLGGTGAPGAPGAGKPLALIGGGIGLAPLLFLARRLPPGSFHLLAGYRSGVWGLEGLPEASFTVFTEDGSSGRRGRVLDGFEPAPYSALLACGPEPMLRALSSLAEASALPAWLSLETRMACGVGACLGCTVRTRSGNRRACVEGPIFPASEVIFDE